MSKPSTGSNVSNFSIDSSPVAPAQPDYVAPVPADRPRQLLTGKVAIVTGSESGIGRETARQLCEQGASVVLNGLNPTRLEQTVRAFRQAGYSAVGCLADVTDYEQCQTLIDTAVENFGRIDILITNASISMRAYFADLTPDVFRRVMDSNIYGSVYPLKAALPYLTESAGSVTFISSISALNGMPSGSAYCAGKAALSNLAHTLRLELRSTGIHLGVVHIGFTQNDSDKRVLDAAGQPVPIAYRNPRWQMSQTQVALAILRHIRTRRQRTILSPTGMLIHVMTTYFPRLADRIILWTMKQWPRSYE
ncbi:NAD(P)-dependent dehydrogenase (short-subunit alcohol dehydrogenase family) [Spirosoma lacussanchae]|uniref:SDR family oxidoreductase n=1 Tax=Spirosoma lacussanchae TaxID=1884249 RepID=UPI001FEC67F7|nr:SDR family oxidoreductase [Spirosoma lacussanchae]